MYKTIHFLPLFLLSLLAATSCQSDKPGRLKTIYYESCLASKRAMHLSDIADTYNPQNEMFRLLGTKRSFSQNETFFFSHP